MSNYSDLLQSIKQAATQAVDASNPVNICFGKVMSASPLKVMVDQKLLLSSAQLLLTNNVTDYETKITLLDELFTEDITHNHSYTDTSDGGTSSGTTGDNTHNHEIKIVEKRVKIHNALKDGDNVIMVRQQGGQKYVIIDKVVVNQ